MIIAETDRLSVSQLSLPDAPFILELVNTPGWLAFIGDRGIKTIQAAEQYIINGPMASYQTNGFGLYRVALKETAVPIGICGIIKRDTLSHADIGFAQLPDYSGNGYAFEAAAAVLQYARDKLDLKTMLAITMPENERSVKLLTKLGLLFEKNIQLPHSKAPLMLFTTT